MKRFYLVQQETKIENCHTDRPMDYKVLTLFFDETGFDEAYSRYELFYKAERGSVRIKLCVHNQIGFEEIILTSKGEFRSDLPF
jgi:hypothetical protein